METYETFRHLNPTSISQSVMVVAVVGLVLFFALVRFFKSF